jgi:hypothetical protein
VPLEKGHSASPFVVTVSIRNRGALLAPVEMMTQRPVTGSFLRSAIWFIEGAPASNALRPSYARSRRISTIDTTSKRYATPPETLL